MTSNNISNTTVKNINKENGHVQHSAQSTTTTNASSLRKKGVKDFEFGKTLGEGSYSTVCRKKLWKFF